MVQIRPYNARDSMAAGILIADCYTKYVLDFVPKRQFADYLGPFFYARSSDPAHQQQIAMFIQAAVVFVAEDENGDITGLLRGQPGRLHCLFVADWYFFQNTGRLLLEKFEQYNQQMDSTKITLAAHLYSIPFYLRLGYKRSTGIRSGWSFQGRDLKWQPMKKVLAKPQKQSTNK